jgi:outer membrane protein
MKKRYLILWLSLLFSAGAWAQQEASESFTLEQAIDYALVRSVKAQNAKIDERIAAARVNETIGFGLPQVSLSAGIQHNEKLRRFFTTYDPTGGFIDLSGVPGIQPGDVVAATNFFQLKSGGDVGVTVSQLIFSGSYLVGLKAANAYKEFAERNTAITREQIVQEVTKAYYVVLINRERIKIFDTNIARVDSLLRNTKAYNANGFVENIDVDRIQVQLNNLVTERSNFINIDAVGKELLKLQMGYPIAKELEVSGAISDFSAEIDLQGLKNGWDYKNRADYLVFEANQKLQTLNIKNQYAGALPVISAFANIGYASQSPNVGGLFKTNANINDTGFVGPDKWYDYSMFGVSLNWNLFTGLSRQYKIQQEKLTLIKIENGFTSLKSGIDFELKQTSLVYQNALQSLSAQKQNMDLASNIARVTKIKYEQGVGSNLEVTDAESSLKQAQINYYSALFDAMLAKVDLDKAYGRLKRTL